MPKDQPENDDDGNGYADQPKQRRAHIDLIILLVLEEIMSSDRAGSSR